MFMLLPKKNNIISTDHQKLMCPIQFLYPPGLLWNFPVAYSKAKCKINGNKASPSFKTFWERHVADRCAPTIFQRGCGTYPEAKYNLCLILNSMLTFWRQIFLQILAHPVFKMWVIQKPNKVALWNKQHFEEKKMEIIQHVWNIQYGYLLNKYKMGHLEGNLCLSYI